MAQKRKSTGRARAARKSSKSTAGMRKRRARKPARVSPSARTKAKRVVARRPRRTGNAAGTTAAKSSRAPSKKASVASGRSRRTRARASTSGVKMRSPNKESVTSAGFEREKPDVRSGTSRRVFARKEPEREREPAEALIPGAAGDDLAEELGQEYVESATSGEQAAEDIRDQIVPEESGGPFVETSADSEFAYGTDESNPADAQRAAFPTTRREK